ncbi:putative signal peptide protein [Puccinia sorghi]|uniref:Putative signal peptide protein n=1 Tax=Puccinia sorghi TaxID=27349 RepID=A0A0L6VHG1_9BASI|nr:putative signal peptide protein [Puccinia sorghi]
MLVLMCSLVIWKTRHGDLFLVKHSQPSSSVAKYLDVVQSLSHKFWLSELLSRNPPSHESWCSDGENGLQIMTGEAVRKNKYEGQSEMDGIWLYAVGHLLDYYLKNSINKEMTGEDYTTDLMRFNESRNYYVLTRCDTTQVKIWLEEGIHNTYYCVSYLDAMQDNPLAISAAKTMEIKKNINFFLVWGVLFVFLVGKIAVMFKVLYKAKTWVTGVILANCLLDIIPEKISLMAKDQGIWKYSLFKAYKTGHHFFVTSEKRYTSEERASFKVFPGAFGKNSWDFLAVWRYPMAYGLEFSAISAHQSLPRLCPLLFIFGMTSFVEDHFQPTPIIPLHLRLEILRPKVALFCWLVQRTVPHYEITLACAWTIFYFTISQLVPLI